MIDLSQTGVMPLENLYLVAICKMAESEKLGTALQDFGNGAGRLWLMPANTTTPDHQIEFKFDKDSVALAVASRNEREFKPRVVKYSEGIDGFCKDLQKHLRANLIEHKRAA
jgi:hypothetical protein